MERIRIGNNIAISWAVYDLNGRIHNLEGKDIQLYMAVGGYKVYVNSYTIQGNVISWVFLGSEQTKTGDYKLVLEETDPLSGASAFDVRAAFRLTPEDVVGPDIVLGPANVSVQSVLTYSNLVGVESIDVVESSEDSGDNIVTIHLIDGSFAEVVIKNGSKGPKGDTGATGATGPKGDKGDVGERGPVGVDAVNAAIGTNDPSQAPSVDKTFADGVLGLTFNNIKGAKGDKGDQGNTGSSVDYPYELVNNVTTDDATKGLSAAQGVVLDNKVERAISALYNEKRTVELDDMKVLSSGFYLNIEDAEAGIITQNDNHRIVMFDVSGCTDIEGQYASSSLVLLLIFVKDANGNIIASYSGTGTTDKFQIHVNEPFSNGCVVYINDFNYSQVSRNLQSIDITYKNPYIKIDKHLLSIDKELQMQDGVETMAEVTMPDFSNAGYINADGELITPSSFHATDFLPVVGGSKLTCKLSAAANIAYVAFYTDDSEEDFLSVSIANTGQVIEIQVPSTANYFRASTNFNTSSETYISDAFVKYLTLGYGSKRLKDIEDEIAALTPGESKIITTKKWVAIGDSITWLDGHKQGVAERPEHGYQHYLQQRIQFGECVNNGISGKTMFDYPFDQITTQADIYTIALGINDWSDTKLTPVGSLTDYKNYVTTTGTGEYATVTNFAEALARLIIKIKRVSTNAFVILITPKRSNSYTSETAHFPDSSMVANAGGIYLHQYADIIKEVAEYEGYPCVDLYHNGGFTDQNMSALCYDNLHPNDIGMMLIANDLYSAMEKICRSYIID